MERKARYRASSTVTKIEMSQLLLGQCLKFPALVAQQPAAGLGATAHERRELDEQLSRTLLLQQANSTTSKRELEQSIALLKKQLRSETQQLALQRLLHKRIMQTRIESEPFMRAALAEQDDLVFEILKLQRTIHDAEFTLEQALSAQTQVVEAHDRFEHARTAKRQRLAENETITDLQRERSALRHLFFALIMESGVDWKQDDVLRKIVWSFR